MVHLELSLAETQQLQQWLMDALQGQTVSPERQQTFPLLLTKLRMATDSATCPTECPVCHTWFTQEKTGRTGRYCSTACKQRAYRQRQQAWRKQIRSAPRR
jgi:hypothetical protein